MVKARLDFRHLQRGQISNHSKKEKYKIPRKIKAIKNKLSKLGPKLSFLTYYSA